MFTDIDRGTNRELFWRKMALTLWGGKDKDPAAVRAKQEDIKYKNSQFNLQTHLPLNERYKGGFKEGDVVTEQFLNNQSSARNNNNKKLMNYHEIGDDINSNAQGNSYKYRVSKHGFSSPKKFQILSKKSYFLGQNKIPKNKYNNNINKDSSKFIDIRFDEEDLDHQGIHEINAGTNKYVYTEPVTTADPAVLKLLNNGSKTTTSYGTVNADKDLNTVKDNIENSKDDNLKRTYAGRVKNEFSNEMVKRTSSSDSTSFDKDKTIKKSDTEKQNKKLDDFMGPFVEGNTPRDIYDQNNWQNWFNGFLPKEEAVGHNYQQELLSKMFPKNNFQPDVQTQEPRLITVKKSKIPSESHDLPNESHDHGNDYAPMDIDPQPWQSYTPVYSNKHQPTTHHSEKYHERTTSFHRPQQNPRKER